MKLTEEQAFKIMERVESYFNLKDINYSDEDISNFVMMELINLELPNQKKKEGVRG